MYSHKGVGLAELCDESVASSGTETESEAGAGAATGTGTLTARGEQRRLEEREHDRTNGQSNEQEVVPANEGGIDGVMAISKLLPSSFFRPLPR